MKKVLIALPVFNEAYILEKNVRDVHAWCVTYAHDWDWRIVIADNASTDETLLLAYELAEKLSRVFVYHTNERGRGQALRRAWSANDADCYAYMDVDLAVDLSALPRLITPILENIADITIGSRLIVGATVNRSTLREITSRTYNILVDWLLRLPVRDTQCGFKAVNRRVREELLHLTTDPHWFWDTELLAVAHAQNFKIKEIPVRWVETRTVGRKSKVSILKTSLNYLKNLLKLRKKMISLQKK